MKSTAAPSSVHFKIKKDQGTHNSFTYLDFMKIKNNDMSITTTTTIFIGDEPGAKKLEQIMPISFFNKLKDIRGDLRFLIKELILSN